MRSCRLGRVDGNGENQAEGVDEQVELLALDLLARVIARRVDARAPFSAPITLWLSITPALGEASRPSSSPGHEVERVMNPLQRAVPVPQHEIIVHRGLGRQILGQRAPLASRSPEHREPGSSPRAHPPRADARRAWSVVSTPRSSAHSCIPQITRIANTLALVEPTVLARPHRPPPEKRIGSQYRITNDSNESTSFRTDTKILLALGHPGPLPSLIKRGIRRVARESET